MYAANFDYYRPKTIAEAIELLRKNKKAKVLAGGHSLLPAMKLRLAEPSALVDISRIKALAGIKVGKRVIKIGALTTHAAVAASPELMKACPILPETALSIGDAQVRNRGTLGGSVAHADPAADYPAVLLALDAIFTATGKAGPRDIPAAKFFKDLFTTALKPGELLTTITIPAYGNQPHWGGRYLKHRHPASHYAVVGAAALVRLEAGKVAQVSLVVGGVTATPVRCSAVEAALLGQAPTEANLEAAVLNVAGALTNPLADVYASGEYRVQLAAVLAKRALNSAAARARGV